MDMSVITFNISADFLDPPGVPAWDERKLLLSQVLRDAQPSLIGLQEVTPRQLSFLQDQLPRYTALTVPVVNPDPGLVATWQAKYTQFGLPQIPTPYEITLFYQPDIFELLDSGHWWLSPTPDRPSIGFGNTAPRVVLWAQVQHRASRHKLVVFNTHIDHRCTRAMVDLCRQTFTNFATHASSLIFVGDLNFNPGELPYASLMSDGWLDSHEIADTFESATFLYDLPGIPGGRIDHILYRGDGLTPRTWARLLSPDPERRLSDHDPVYVRFSIEQR